MATETLTHQNGVVPNGDHGTNSATVKKSRESERRRRRRQQKKINKASKELKANASEDDKDTKAEPQQVVEQIEIEYVPEKAELYEGLDEEFKKIFEKFSFSEVTGSEDNDKKDEPAENSITKKKADSDSEEEEENDNEQKEKGVSNKKKKLQRRMNIAELKQISSRPDVVEGKRGIEKQPFQLPDFIAATGIEKIRQAYIEKEDSKKLKQKQRERMQPKMGKMDIDYQVLHDAFFKYQTKPKLSSLGELYHEGKEFEVKLREMKPGMLSHELKEALGMPEGSPPPWLINMQRYGPPPSYPHLKIPGLNAPIPPGASFGYHPGGWGKPPVDEGLSASHHPPFHFIDFFTCLHLSSLGVHFMEMFLVFISKISLIMRSIFTAGTEKVPKACYDGTDAPPHVGIRCCQRLLGCCLISVMTTIVVNLTLMLPELLCCCDERKDQDRSSVALCNILQGGVKEEPVDKTKHWGDLEEEEEDDEEEEEEEVEMEEDELEDGIQSVDSLSSTPTGVETPDVIDLRKQQRKEPERPLYQVLEEKEEKLAPGTLLGTTHTYVVGTGTQDKSGAKRVDLLKGQKTDKVDVTLLPEELDAMENVLPAKYEEAREEEKLRSQREDFSDMVAENEKKRKRKMHEKDGKSKKKDFKF
ncbi:hypothetical protein TSUD_86240 [Trifolium subterraneum]|uniref:PSP proline-rich domain-containing protein n=1 Tax=Trifolium subterraneum TaxID=3900 RepID=A0A2Z6PJM1_TRISU|nr:hypothetical protein TSUD_86240 [Trifolium subterraneum]